jgi:O-antigen biosynthesis protein
MNRTEGQLSNVSVQPGRCVSVAHIVGRCAGPLIAKPLRSLGAGLRRLARALRDARRATRPFRRSLKSRLRDVFGVATGRPPGARSGNKPGPASGFGNAVAPVVDADLTSLGYLPTVSILVPVYNQSAVLLDRLVKSVQAQSYPYWQLCFSDDGSTNPETIAFLRDLLPPDLGRIDLFFANANHGISNATNVALRRCAGEYICLLDHDDELTPNALLEVVAAINKNPLTDVLYSDEDKIDSGGATYDHFHKPDWSPAFAMGVMYIGHLLTVRRQLALDVGGFDPRYDKVQDFDFLLRLSERTNRITHIPRILYHWRSVPGSLASGTDQKPNIGLLQAAAVTAHLERQGIEALATPHPDIDQRVLLRPRPRHRYPLISILIPIRCRSALVARCLESLFAKTTYPSLEVILIGDRLVMPGDLDRFTKYPVKRIPYQDAFQLSRVHNIAAQQAAGEYLVLLNSDTQVITPNWLELLLLHAELPGVAAVGPKLLDPDNSVAHAGIVLGIRGAADHVMRGLPGNADGYFGSLACAREVSALTGACLMVRRNDYLQLGGFSEDYAVHYQDFDFCLRLLDQGRRIVLVPHAALYHHEAVHHRDDDDALDRALFIDTWRHQIKNGDRYYNRNFFIDPSASYQIRPSR